MVADNQNPAMSWNSLVVVLRYPRTNSTEQPPGKVQGSIRAHPRCQAAKSHWRMVLLLQLKAGTARSPIFELNFSTIQSLPPIACTCTWLNDRRLKYNRLQHD